MNDAGSPPEDAGGGIGGSNDTTKRGLRLLGRYLLALLNPGLCYVGATILVPSDTSAQTDWHAHFFRVRRPLFAVAAAGAAVLLANATIGGSLPMASLEVALGAGVIGLYLVGFFVASQRAHEIIVVVNAALVVGAYAPLIYRPLGA